TATADSRVVAHLVPDDITDTTLAGIYDVATGRLMTGPIDVGGFADTAVLSAGGDTLFAAMHADGSIRAFDATSRTLRGVLPAAEPVMDPHRVFGWGTGLAATGDGSVVIGSAIGVVRVVDAATLAVVATLHIGNDVTHSVRSVGDRSIVGSGP